MRKLILLTSFVFVLSISTFGQLKDGSPIARAAGAQGEAIIEVQVDAQGNVLAAKMISGHPFLQKVSEEAAQQWKFSSVPGSTKQRAVRLTFAYREVDKGPNPKNEFTTIFMPPYKVEVQAHPRVID